MWLSEGDCQRLSLGEEENNATWVTSCPGVEVAVPVCGLSRKQRAPPTGPVNHWEGSWAGQPSQAVCLPPWAPGPGVAAQGTTTSVRLKRKQVSHPYLGGVSLTGSPQAVRGAIEAGFGEPGRAGCRESRLGNGWKATWSIAHAMRCAGRSQAQPPRSGPALSCWGHPPGRGGAELYPAGQLCLLVLLLLRSQKRSGKNQWGLKKSLPAGKSGKPRIVSQVGFQMVPPV